MSRFLAASLALLLACDALGQDAVPAIRGKSQRALWSAPATQPDAPPPARCSRPVFSPDGQRVAWFVAKPPESAVWIAKHADGGQPPVSWQFPDPAAECVQLGFSPDGSMLAAVVRFARGGAVIRGLSVGSVTANEPPALIGNERVAVHEFVFDSAGKRIALSTGQGIALWPVGGKDAELQLLLEGTGTKEEAAPYHDLAWSPAGDFLVAVGQVAPPFTVQGSGPGYVVFLDGKDGKPSHVKLPVCTTSLTISPDGRQVAGPVWTHSPVGVERPGGLMVWDLADLKAGKLDGRWALDPKRFIAGVHVYPGMVFWFDGKLTAVATELAPEPNQLYRRFGLWQVQPDGSAKRLSVIGPMPKRTWPDPAGRGRLMWRYQADAGLFLLDERTGRFFRLDDKLNSPNWTQSLSPDLKRMVIAKDHQVILHELATEE